MVPGRLALVISTLGALGACAPTLVAGYDASTTVHGPLAGILSTRPDANNYSFGIGGGARDFSIELGVQPRSTLPGPAIAPATSTGTPAVPPRYVAATGSLDMRWTPIRCHALSLNVHVGPSLGVLAERTTGAFDIAQGYRTGAGVAVSVSHVTAFVDIYRAGYIFSAGPASGISELLGVTVGLALR